MGRITLETDSAKFELERSDEEVFKCLQSLTGIRVAFKEGQRSSSIAEIETETASEVKSFNRDTLPSREDLVEFILEHLDGFNIPISLEYFFGDVPKYGVSKDQDALLGTYSSRLLRARRLVEEQKGGVFDEVIRSGQKLLVFKSNSIVPPNETGMDDLDIPNVAQKDNQEHLFEEEEAL